MKRQSRTYRAGGTVGLVGWCLAAHTAGLIALSLAPFSFEGSFRIGELCRAVGWPASGFEDLAANFLAYVPFGLLAAAALHRWRGASAWTVATAGGALLSLAMECVQTRMPSRVASWYDVCTNGCGAMVGASAWVAWGMLRARLGATASWLGSMGRLRAHWPWGLAAGLAVYSLAPFDLVTSEAAFRDALRRVRLWPLTHEPMAGAVSELTVGLLAAQAVSAVLFALLGYGCALRARASRRLRGACLAGGVVVVGLGGAIEALQLFTMSHAFDTLDIVFAAVGGVCGVLAAALRLGGCVRIATRHVAAALLAVLLAGVLLASWPAGTNWAPSASINVVPLWRFYSRPLLAAAGDLLETVVVFSLIAGLARLASRRWGRPARVASCIALALCVALGCEYLQGFTPGRYADPTDPLVALVISVVVACVRVRRPPEDAARASAARI